MAHPCGSVNSESVNENKGKDTEYCISYVCVMSGEL